MKASQLIPAVKKAPVVGAKKIKSPKAGPECALCEFVMNKVDSILGDNATKVCGAVGGEGVDSNGNVYSSNDEFVYLYR